MFTYDIDLTDKCIVLFGENGTGKSTVLLILNIILNNKIHELIKYPFHKIRIKYEGQKNEVVIKYSDLFVDKNIFIDMSPEEKLSHFGYHYDYNFSYDQFSNYLSNLDEKKYQNLVRELIFGLNDDERVYTIFATSSEDRKLLEILAAKIKRLYSKIISEGSYFEFVFYKKDIKIEIIEAVYISSVKDVIINDNKILNSLYWSNDLRKISSIIDKYPQYTDLPDWLISPLPNNHIKTLIGEFSSLEEVNTIRKIYSNIGNIHYNKINFETADKYTELLNVNSYCNIFYFTKNEYIKFNQQAIDLVMDQLEYNPESENELEVENYYNNQENIEYIKNEIIPLLIEGSPFKKSRYNSSYYRSVSMTKLDDIFVEFIEDYRNRILDSRNPLIIELENELNNFFYEKEVKIKPSGLFVYSIIGELLNLNELSSGEKKLISLFFKVAFNNKQVIIIDEPEVSMSIIWQEKLISTIKTLNPNAKIIIAAHTPYITSTEETYTYLIPLRNLEVIRNE